MNILEELRWILRCLGCTYHCSENLGYTYCCHGRLDTNTIDPCYPKINKTCCPKIYPLSVYLRNLAGVWNNNFEIWCEGDSGHRKVIAKLEDKKTSYPNKIGSFGGKYDVEYI